MTHGTPTSFHSDTRNFDGHGTYALSAEQARSILTVQSLLSREAPTNTCSLYSTASLPNSVGFVHVADWTGTVVIVDRNGAIFRNYEYKLFPQHDYTLASEPPAKPLAESGPNADLIPNFPRIPVADRTI
jgi:hypothetical protein